MGYHTRKIEKGVVGEASKIREEFEEFMDAVAQKNRVMELVELSDLLGAVELYVKRYNLDMYDLLLMSQATQDAFKDGTRKSHGIDADAPRKRLEGDTKVSIVDNLRPPREF
jgi:hypothetical protein